MEQQVIAPVQAGLVDVAFTGGESYEALVRGHRIVVDQPVADGGADSAPTPVELLAAALATCAAFYAGRYLSGRGYARDGLTVSAGFTMAADRPARVSEIRLVVTPPAGLPSQRRPALRAAATHCTVHNTLVSEPSLTVELG